MNESKKRNSDLKIAIVDDSEFSRNTITEVLEKEGFNVVCSASNAEEGLSSGKIAGANLYIIDVIMPERSGLEMANIISENSMRTKIIMMSSLNNEQIIIESISSGAIDFLSKPFDPADLIKAVEKIEIERE